MWGAALHESQRVIVYPFYIQLGARAVAPGQLAVVVGYQGGVAQLVAEQLAETYQVGWGMELGRASYVCVCAFRWP